MLLVAAPAKPQADIPGVRFPFVIPWDDSAPSLVDVSFLNRAPAGAHGYIQVRGSHFVESGTGRRIRFLGVNFAEVGAPFPTHRDAEKIAAHLAKYGVNLVRFLGIDDIWDSKGTIWDTRYKDHRFDPVRLELLDYLIYQLKQHGIYSGVPLHLINQFRPEDGFADTVRKLPFEFGNRVDEFDAHMIALQKSTARTLLTHVNPYTHRAYVDEPAILDVEITNEDSLLGDEDNLGGGLDRLPEPFAGELKALWNAWLARRYPSASHNVPLPGSPRGREREEWVAFLCDTELAFAREMRRFLKEELHLHSLVVCSQVSYGGLFGQYRELRMDYVDQHGYWSHPEFPHTQWDSADWTINPVSMAARMGERWTLPEIGEYRDIQKPYSISEYNLAAPNPYQSECMPLLASFAAFQDWDAITPFDYGYYGAQAENAKIQGWFALGANPAKWAFFPSAALLFRAGEIPSTVFWRTVSLPATLTATALLRDRSTLSIWGRAGIDPHAGLSHRLGVSIGGSKATQTSPTSLRGRTGRDKAAPVLGSETAREETARYTADAPCAKVVVGFVAGKRVILSGATFAFGQMPNRFAAVTLVAVDRKPLSRSARLLLTAVDRVENTGMRWNAAHNSVGEHWGTAPTLADAVPVAVTLKTDGPRRVVALDERGLPKQSVPSLYRKGQLTFRVGPSNRTLWYAVTK